MLGFNIASSHCTKHSVQVPRASRLVEERILLKKNHSTASLSYLICSSKTNSASTDDNDIVDWFRHVQLLKKQAQKLGQAGSMAKVKFTKAGELHAKRGFHRSQKLG
jgi:hypothetical protein